MSRQGFLPYHAENTHFEVEMGSNLLLRQIFGVTLSILLFTSFFFVGCGASEEDNSQPFIETISDKTLNVGDETTVEVNITDADVDDTHIISAFTDDTIIATVSVRDTTLTIMAMEAGTATVTVTATDDSGQDNVASVPVTFEVTVNEPPPSVQIGIGINQPPSSFIDKGACTVGMTLKPGKGCSYDSNEPFAEIIFSVLQDGTVCREQVPLRRVQIEIPEQFQVRNTKFCVEWNIERDNFFGTSFSASKNPDGSWTIENVP